MLEFGNPAAIITKNHLITRDIDLLAQLAKLDAAVVLVSVTTLDHELAGKMEPRTSARAATPGSDPRIERRGNTCGRDGLARHSRTDGS